MVGQAVVKDVGSDCQGAELAEALTEHSPDAGTPSSSSGAPPVQAHFCMCALAPVDAECCVHPLAPQQAILNCILILGKVHVSGGD